MQIWDEYPEFFRRVPDALVRKSVRSPLRMRSGESRSPKMIRENPPVLSIVPVKGRLPNTERKPVLELPLAVRRRLGLSDAKPGARLAGARAKQSGREFEAEIELANAFNERRGIAVVYRHHPMIEGWGRTLRVVGKGPADFSGVVRLPTGTSAAIAFDCKVVSGSASYRHAPRDRHQLESLLRFRAAGGRAFLLLCCRVLNCVWLLEDLDTLWRGERVNIRRRTDHNVEHHLPAISASSTLDTARAVRPHWDYLRLLDKRFNYLPDSPQDGDRP